MEHRKETIDKKVRDTLLSFASRITDNTIISGGHFILRRNKKPDINSGTLTSFDLATHIFAEVTKQKEHIGLGLLVNDIGSTCDANVCYTMSEVTKKSFTLPDEYRVSLHNVSVTEHELSIFWEKHIRNRGKKEFLKKIKKIPEIEEGTSGWFLRENGGKKIMMTRRMFKDPYGTPACPLIMAAYALEQEKMGYTTSLNFYYVDTDNFENIPNHFMIEKGYEVAKLFGAKITVFNVYFTKDKIITNF